MVFAPMKTRAGARVRPGRGMRRSEMRSCEPLAGVPKSIDRLHPVAIEKQGRSRHAPDGSAPTGSAAAHEAPGLRAASMPLATTVHHGPDGGNRAPARLWSGSATLLEVYGREV